MLATQNNNAAKAAVQNSAGLREEVENGRTRDALAELAGVHPFSTNSRSLSGFEGDVFPIVRRVAGQWVCGGIPSESEMTSYDLDFAAPPGMTLPPAY